MRREWLLAAAVTLLTLVAAARVASTHRVFAATVDEPIHLAAGYDALRGDVPIDLTHPPLGRVLAGMPFVFSSATTVPQGADMFSRGNELLYDGGRYADNLARGRRGNLLLLAVGAIGVALLARRWFDDTVAVAAVALFTAHPLILAHAGLITTDLAIAATFPFVLLALDAFLQRPDLRRGALLGIALAAGLLSKFSFFVFFPPAALALILVRARVRPRLLPLAVAAVTAIVLFWGAYGFRVGRPADVRGDALDLISWATPQPFQSVGRHLARVSLPAPDFAVGMAELQMHAKWGHKAFLLGEVRWEGWWYYFPVVFFYKSPLPWLILCAWGAVLALLRRDRAAISCLLVAAGVMGVAMTGTINIGARHVLPIVGPLSILAGFAAVAMWRAKRRHLARGALAVLLLWYFGGVAAAHPDYLAWFNETAGSRPSRIAVDSNLDWGQDALRLVRLLRERKIVHFHFGMPHALIMDAHGLIAEKLVPGRPVKGWVAVSESALRLDPADYAWLQRYQPVEIVGESIRLYWIP